MNALTQKQPNSRYDTTRSSIRNGHRTRTEKRFPPRKTAKASRRIRVSKNEYAAKINRSDIRRDEFNAYFDRLEKQLESENRFGQWLSKTFIPITLRIIAGLALLVIVAQFAIHYPSGLSFLARTATGTVLVLLSISSVALVSKRRYKRAAMTKGKPEDKTTLGD
jgi:hypothetical protein